MQPPFVQVMVGDVVPFGLDVIQIEVVPIGFGRVNQHFYLHVGIRVFARHVMLIHPCLDFAARCPLIQTEATQFGIGLAYLLLFRIHPRFELDHTKNACCAGFRIPGFGECLGYGHRDLVGGYRCGPGCRIII